MAINKKLVGTTVGNLKILSYFFKKVNGHNRQYFEYECACGKISFARCESIKKFTTQSCGCISGDLISVKNRLPNESSTLNKIWHNYIKGAKDRNLSFLLDRIEFNNLIHGDCYYCGSAPKETVFTAAKNRRKRTVFVNGIDRMNNLEGYELSNCVSCCSFCNYSKSNRTLEEFEEWIQNLIKFQTEKHGNQKIST